MVEVTAILNCHNSSKVVELLPRALNSIVDQEFDREWELIVVNDGKPSEELVNVVKPYAQKFEDKSIKFTFFGTEEESGYQCRPKNVAITHMEGEYVSFLDYDNEWTPNHLQVLYNALVEGTVWPDFTYGRRKYILDKGVDKKATLPGGKEVELPEGETQLVEWNEQTVAVLGSSALRNFVDTSDFMTSRGALWRLHLATDMMWNEKVRRFGDWELICRAAFFAGWRGKAVDEVVNLYHWHGENLQLTRPVKEVPEKESI